jgi:TPR repeat protein
MLPRPAILLAALLLVGCHPEQELAKRERSQCQDGDAAACHAFGSRLLDGAYVLRDAPRAATLLDTACVGGIAASCAQLGLMHQQGRGVETDSTRALGLGRLLATGDGIPADPARAATLYQRACDNDEMDGCTLLGAAYEAGTGVTQDYSRAAAIYKDACDENFHGEACFRLALLHQNGQGVPASPAEAARLTRRACFSDYRPACPEESR